ncbi:transposase family protein [Streptomyces sp. NBC_00654]|nr:transposase family protein [Streptomyces sp. NBC_00654]
MQVRRPATGRKDREKFISGKNKQNTVKSMVVTDAEGRLLFCSPAEPASCADITHARKLGLVELLADGPDVEILADAGYQGLGDGRTRDDTAAPQVQEEPRPSGTRSCTNASARPTPHAVFASSTASGTSRSWRALARHHGRREHMSDINWRRGQTGGRPAFVPFGNNGSSAAHCSSVRSPRPMNRDHSSLKIHFRYTAH